jgi:hypothetical protein
MNIIEIINTVCLHLFIDKQQQKNRFIIHLSFNLKIKHLKVSQLMLLTT